MKIIKVSNLAQSDGMCDYKGLDISKFIPGSQIYDHDANTCMIHTAEEIDLTHEDLEEVSMLIYEEYKTRILANRPKTDFELMQERLIEAEQAAIELSTIIGGMM